MKERAHPPTRTPRAQLGGRKGPTELVGDMRQAPAFEVMEREQGAFVGRKLGEDGFDFVGREARCWIGCGVDRFGLGHVVRRSRWLDQPATSYGLAAKVIASGICGDAEQPVREGLLRTPPGQTTYHAEKRVLNEIIEVGLRADKAPKQAGHGGVVTFHENFHCRAVSLTSA